jgi:hypothetical protein
MSGSDWTDIAVNPLEQARIVVAHRNHEIEPRIKVKCPALQSQIEALS